MTARTPSTKAGSAPGRADRERSARGRAALSPRLRSALGIAVLGAVLMAIGSLLPMTSPLTRAGFAATPLLFVLGILPAAIACCFAVLGRPFAVTGVLLASAVFAPGRVLSDAQLAVDGSVASRPELAMPTSLTPLHGAMGLWLLLAGQVLTLVAGMVAFGEPGGDGTAPTSVTDTETRPNRRQGPLALALCLGFLAAVGLLAAPFASGNAFQLANDTLDSPVLVKAGGLLIALAVPVVASLAVTAGEPGLTRGWLLGGAAAVVVIALPRVVSGLAVPRLHPTWGPYLALLVALALVVFAVFAEHAVPSQVAAGSAVAGAAAGDESGEVQLPGRTRLHALAGGFALLAAVAAVIGASTSLIVVPDGLPRPGGVAGRPLIPAAILIGVLGAAMLVPRWASAVRPALAVGWVVVPLAGAGALDEAFSATQITGVTIGAGTWIAGLAMVAAIVAAACAGLAGGLEREDVDLTGLSPRLPVVGPSVAAALLAFGAFGLPILRAADYTPPGLWSNFRVESWGLLFGLVAVVVAAGLAPMCRPSRAVALLLGAVGVVAVHLLEWPLTADRATDSSAGTGVWIGAACGVALVIAALAAGWFARARRTFG